MTATLERRSTPGVRPAPTGNYMAQLCALYVEEQRKVKEAAQLFFFLGLGLGLCGAVLAVGLTLWMVK